MDGKIHCPSCERVLRLPASAAGRHARCPACHVTFVVPKGEELVEETISSWIEEDVQEMHEKHEQALLAARRAAAEEDRVRAERDSVVERRKAAERDAAAASARAEAARAVAAAQQRAQPISQPRIDPDAKHTRERGTASDPIWASEAGEVRGGGANHRQEVAEPSRGVPVINHAGVQHMPTPQRRVSPPTSFTDDDDAPISFPTDLHVQGPVPHLIVHDVSQEGVVFAFDAVWLDHVGFRLSMPMECIFTGNTARNELLARPLIFEDQCKMLGRSRTELEIRHEHHLLAGQTARDAMRSIDKIEFLPKPFNLPMPYYVDQKHTAHSVHAWTENRALGETTCFVQVVSGDYALNWLLRVNGAIGPEYDMLERAVASMWSGPWANLSELVRSRLEVWCKFAPMEHFRLFIPDADFSKADMGLGGLVMTDRRLMYCKYKHRGSFPIDKPCELHIKVNRDSADLTLHHDAGRTRICKIHLADLQQLVDHLTDSIGMRTVVDETDAEPTEHPAA